MGDMADYQIEQGELNDALGEDLTSNICGCGREVSSFNGVDCDDCFDAQSNF